MPNPDSFGLDAAFPAVVLALVLPSLTDRSTRNAALAGAAIAVAVTPVLPAGLPVLLALAGLALAIKKPDPAQAQDPVEATPVEATPVEATPVEATPVEATPVEAVPAETTPIAEVRRCRS
jgi:hypothetical protein